MSWTQSLLFVLLALFVSSSCGTEVGEVGELGGSNLVGSGHCTPSSCSGRGQCDDSGQELVCTCDETYRGETCELCVAGYHLAGDQCVADESCQGTSCPEPGACGGSPCPPSPSCGDNPCGRGESCATCEADCGPCGTGASWYVDNAASGANSGDSWADAWQSFAAIGWSSIGPGDTLYISGATTSQTYNEAMDLQQSGTSGNPITITKGADTGHAGTVLLQGPGSGRGISMITASHITISGLSLKGWKTAIYISGSSGSAYSESSAAKQIIIENNDITFDAGRGVFIQTSDHITVRNNYMETPDNVDAQTDGIYSQRNHLNTYEGNTIIINNQDTGGHDDCIQLYDDTDITIRGNYVEQHNDKSGNAQGIYATTMYGTSYYYNNVVNLRNAQSNGLTFRKLTGTGTVVMIGNTVYSIRAYHTAQITETADPVVKNNIFFHDVASPSFDLTGWSGDPSNIDGNLYFTAGGSGKAGSLNGSSKSFSAWQALGFDANGMYADPKVVSIPNKDFRLQSTSPAVDAGRALGTPYAFDKDGVPRAQGSGWDIGAYEQ